MEPVSYTHLDVYKRQGVRETHDDGTGFGERHHRAARRRKRGADDHGDLLCNEVVRELHGHLRTRAVVGDGELDWPSGDSAGLIDAVLKRLQCNCVGFADKRGGRCV